MKNLMLLFVWVLISIKGYAQTEYSFELPINKTFNKKQEIEILRDNKTIGKMEFGKSIIFGQYEFVKQGQYYALVSKDNQFLMKTNRSFTKIWNENGEIVARRKSYKGGKMIWENADNTTIISTSSINKGKINATVYVNNDNMEYVLIALIERLEYSKDVLVSNFSFFI